MRWGFLQIWAAALALITVGGFIHAVQEPSPNAWTNVLLQAAFAAVLLLVDSALQARKRQS